MARKEEAPVPGIPESSGKPLKVCATCSFWSYEFKGFCRRLGQGVGRFWICADWAPAEGQPPERPDRPGASGPTA
jgi:hypothetical protein